MIPIKYKPRIKRDGKGKVKRDFEEPTDELQEAFEEYRNRIEGDSIFVDKLYHVAYDTLEDVDYNLDQVDSLQLLFENTGIHFHLILGNFISAAYNLADQDVIVYQTETDHKPNVGHNLPEEKTLFLKSETTNSGLQSKGAIVNQESVGFEFARYNGGLALNLGEVKRYFAPNNKGVAINFGQIGYPPQRNVFLNFGQVEDFDYFQEGQGLFLSTKQIGTQFKKQAVSSDSIITPDDISNNSGLKEYLRELEEGLTGSDEEIIDFLNEIGPNPADTIRGSLEEFVGDQD